MAFRSTNSTLLRAIIDLMNEVGPSDSYDSDILTAKLKTRGQWSYGKQPLTPERTVNSYLSQSRDVFHHVGSNRYCLRLEYIRPCESIGSGDLGEEHPIQVEQTTYRVLRDTELARRLKTLHGNLCQICGRAIKLADKSYSEAHHIRPLGQPHSGPDVAENILVLCPKHHVMCDYGAIRLSLKELTLRVQHQILQEYLDYHNNKCCNAAANRADHIPRVP